MKKIPRLLGHLFYFFKLYQYSKSQTSGLEDKRQLVSSFLIGCLEVLRNAETESLIDTQAKVTHEQVHYGHAPKAH